MGIIEFLRSFSDLLLLNERKNTNTVSVRFKRVCVLLNLIGDLVES